MNYILDYFKAAMYFAISNLLMRIIFAIIFAIIYAQHAPIIFVEALYTASLIIREVVIFMLPVVICGCISNSIAKLPGKSLLNLLLLLLLVCCSNFMASMIAFIGANIVSSSVTQSIIITNSSDNEVIKPLLNLSIFPKLMPNEAALALGFCMGIINSLKPTDIATKVISFIYDSSMKFLSKIFIPILPIFIAGFVAKISYEGVLFKMMLQNKEYIIATFMIIITYILVIYWLLSKLSFVQMGEFLKNVAPAGMTALSTMSSAAAMPLSLDAAIKNTKNEVTSGIVIPTTVNIHLIGDSIFIPMIAVSIMAAFGFPMPSFLEYLPFAMMFVLSKFAIAAIPGGGILIMIPVLEKSLGFTGEMSAIITAFYILMDPLITTSNVFGNGAFAILANKVMSK